MQRVRKCREKKGKKNIVLRRNNRELIHTTGKYTKNKEYGEKRRINANMGNGACKLCHKNFYSRVTQCPLKPSVSLNLDPSYYFHSNPNAYIFSFFLLKSLLIIVISFFFLWRVSNIKKIIIFL